MVITATKPTNAAGAGVVMQTAQGNPRLQDSSTKTVSSYITHIHSNYDVPEIRNVLNSLRQSILGNLLDSDVQISGVSSSTIADWSSTLLQTDRPRLTVEMVVDEASPILKLNPLGTILPMTITYPDVIEHHSSNLPDPEWESDLHEALLELEQLPAGAKESEDLVPSPATMADARHLLRRMYDISSRRYDVYLMPGGDIAIDGSGQNGARVAIVCESSGGVICLVSPRSLNLSNSYTSESDMPDAVLRKALDVLEPRL